MVELAAIRVGILDDLSDLRRGVVEDADTGDRGKTFALVLLRADHLAGETPDAQARIGEDDAARELGLFRCGAGHQAEAANRLEGDERHDRSGAAAKEIAAGEIRLIRRLSVLIARSCVHPHRTSAL